VDKSITVDCKPNSEFGSDSTCAVLSPNLPHTVPYKTENVFGFCLPPHVSDLPPKAKKGYDAVMFKLRQSKGGQAIDGIIKALSSIYITVATAFIFSLVLLYLMSAYAETIAWICIVLTGLGCFGGSVACFFMRSSIIAQRGVAGTDTALYGDN